MPMQLPAEEYELDSLTRREMDVLVRIEAGYTDKEIAHQLGINHRTVEKHCEHIREKLGVSNRTKVAKVARDRGLLP